MLIWQAHHVIAMKVVLALVIAALSAIELVLLAWLFVLLFVAPGGSAEFRGIHQFAYQGLAEMYLPIPAFVVVFVVVLVCYTRENRKAFASFACALLVAIATSLLLAVFADVGQSGRPWHLIINAIVLAVWTTAIIFRRFISFETSG
jgi:hypothetical protein